MLDIITERIRDPKETDQLVSRGGIKVKKENRSESVSSNDTNTEEQVIEIKGNEAMIIKLFTECIESENGSKEIWTIYGGYVFRTRLLSQGSR